jgi:D12 class N6 adenine-specific DNA methyltransferase
VRTPIPYYGGKQQLASTIISIIPNHKIYVEPFFGGGAVFFSKAPSLVEVINDLNLEMVNFYRYAPCPLLPERNFSVSNETIPTSSLAPFPGEKTTLFYQRPIDKPSHPCCKRYSLPSGFCFDTSFGLLV